MLRALFCDDEPSYYKALSRALAAHDIAVDGRSVREAFFAACAEGSHDVLVVDWCLRTCEGTDVVAELRRRGETRPIALVSGLLAHTHGCELAARAGADLYVEKSKATAAWASLLRELAARPRRAAHASGTYSLEGLAGAVEIVGDEVRLHGVRVGMRRLERLVLAHLLARGGAVVSPEELTEVVWEQRRRPRTPEQERAARNRVAVAVSRFRLALGGAAGIVQTVAGGYRAAVAPWLAVSPPGSREA